VEARDRLDVPVSQCEDEQSGLPRDSLLLITEIAGEGRLVVGSTGNEVDTTFATESKASLQEGPDRVQAVVLVWRRRHGQPRIIGEQGENAVDIGSDVCLGEAPCNVTLPG
jgi:hypothetical protein